MQIYIEKEVNIDTEVDVCFYIDLEKDVFAECDFDDLIDSVFEYYDDQTILNASHRLKSSTIEAMKRIAL